MAALPKFWLFSLIICCTMLRSAQAAISILTPAANTIWYKNNTVQTTWSAGVGDPDSFRIQMQQPGGENVTLADTADGEGYLIRFVNVSETSRIYAESQPFEIAQGISITSSGTTSASSTVAIPGPYTPFSVTPTSTGSPAQATGHGVSNKRFDGGSYLPLVGVIATIGLLYYPVG